jgi:hypothetical protein
MPIIEVIGIILSACLILRLEDYYHYGPTTSKSKRNKLLAQKLE